MLCDSLGAKLAWCFRLATVVSTIKKLMKATKVWDMLNEAREAEHQLMQ